MAVMSDLTPAQQAHLNDLDCPDLPSAPWVSGPPLARRTVALVSTAGLMLRGDRPVMANDTRFRPVPHDVDANDVLMSHVSVNFDRSGFQRDLNVVLPRDRLTELAGDGTIGGIGPNHYAAMGAIHPRELEHSTRALAATLAGEGVDSAVLLPV